MPNYRTEKSDPSFEAPVSVSHIVRTLGRYLPVMALAMGAVMVGYMIVAIAVYVLAGAQSVTTVRFRVEFKGADRGEYPNGTKFSSTEIITTPILLNVFNANELSKYTTFNDFAKSIFVLETNPAYEGIAREYGARLADPKLTSVDRDRLQREYELKLASVSKDQYSLNYARTTSTRAIPDEIVRKVLHDILNEWARLVANEQHVLEYRIALVSPSAITAVPTEQPDLIAATEILRAQILRVFGNIDSLRKFPAAELARSKEGLSLLDISLRLDDILRFRLDPLVNRIATGGLVDDRRATIRFLEAQLAYDQRRLDASKEMAESARMAMMMYMSGDWSATEIADRGSNPPAQRPPRNEGAREEPTLMPQLSESFIDQLIKIAQNDASMYFRQRLTDDYRQAKIAMIPLQAAVTYDTDVLNLVKNAAPENTSLTREEVDRQLKMTRDETRTLVTQIHQVYDTMSRNLNPGTQLLTSLGPPTTRLERSIGIRQLALYGLLVCFIALPIIVAFSLLHNRVREEEAAEELEETNEENEDAFKAL